MNRQTDESPLPDAACANCAIHNAAALKKLGFDLTDVDYVVALAGNPNVGKSTVFNALTGLRQHTGNWPGKTVGRAEGGFEYGDKRYKLVDLPGTYSLLSTSLDEEIARDFLLFGRPDVTVVVVDASRLERNLNLVLQVLQITERVVVCLNLMDEAGRHGMQVDERRLARDLGVPVVPTSARYGRGLKELLQAIHEVATGKTVCRPHRIESEPPQLREPLDTLTAAIQNSYPDLPNARWVALRLLDGDQRIAEALRNGELDHGHELHEDDHELHELHELHEDDHELHELHELHEGDHELHELHEDGHELHESHEDDYELHKLLAGTVNPTNATNATSATNPTNATDATNATSATNPTSATNSTNPADAILALADKLRWEVGADFHDHLVEAIYTEAARLADRAVTLPGARQRFDLDRAIDQLVTSRLWGFPIMIGLFALVFWLTISGANYPSQLLSDLLIGKLYPWLRDITQTIGFPWWLRGILVDGMYLATAWVVSVMLPPMAIFFPLFTLLEDFGYLPRLAFNLDPLFKRAGAHGKQALSMMMGFGCNAAGVIATRIIDSPRERLIAIITNNFALCNGRWPTQILIASLFIGGLVPAYLAGVISALAVVGIALLGVLFTFLTSWALSRTILKGEVSTFSLELPPYRPPRVLQTLYTSLIDRTIYVLWRAVKFAMPAGAAIWLVANLTIAGEPLAAYLVRWLNPLGVLVGLNGIILLAYVVAIPANEIVIPTILMLTVLLQGIHGVGAGNGVLFEVEDQATLLRLFQAGGWTLLTAVNLMLFSLIHNPCSTTIATIYKETGSRKWTAIATLLPVFLGFAVTFLVAQIWRLVG